MIRQPIIVVMGHVDHGKTSLLDRIRSTAITNKEAGGITQHIGASEVPIEVINKICGQLLKKLNANLAIPGLLFIDTPGHEAFTNLRKRGGSVADLALLVIDILKSLEPQTYEAIDILKEYKTPFVVVANKIDAITGWRSTEGLNFTDTLAKQQKFAVEELESKIYGIIGKLSELGFNAERFDRIKDFTKEVVITPVSAKTGEGIPELLMYATGLSQRFLGNRLNIELNEPGRGAIIERMEEKGLGSTIDVVLYNGTLKVNDAVSFATTTGIGTAKIKALLKPKPLQELRESSSKFYYVDHVSAASGVKISGSGLEDALPGSLVLSTMIPNYENEIKTELSEVFIADNVGIILNADSIGSIEALSKLFKSSGIKISKKSIGNVTKRDVLDAFSIRSENPYSGIVVAFNVEIEKEAMEEAYASGINIIKGSIIYKIIEDYKEWLEHEKKEEKELIERAVTFPGKMKILPNSAFRISHPAIFGVEVLAGRMRPGLQIMNQIGEMIGKIKEIQNNGISMQEAKKGESIAMSVEGITFGRQVKDSDILYIFLNDEEERVLRYKLENLLSNEEKDLLEEFSNIKGSSKAK